MSEIKSRSQKWAAILELHRWSNVSVSSEQTSNEKHTLGLPWVKTPNTLLNSAHRRSFIPCASTNTGMYPYYNGNGKQQEKNEDEQGFYCIPGMQIPHHLVLGAVTLWNLSSDTPDCRSLSVLTDNDHWKFIRCQGGRKNNTRTLL